MKPTIGRIVHYVIREGRRRGEHRPATIVRVNGGSCNLHVFTDGPNDDHTEEIHGNWVGSVSQSDGSAPGTWHWPEIESMPTLQKVAAPALEVPASEPQPEPVAAAPAPEPAVAEGVKLADEPADV